MKKKNLEHAKKSYIKDINYIDFPENSIPTSALLNLYVQFNSVLSNTLFHDDGNTYFYQRINV